MSARDRLLSESTMSAPIGAPLERVDLAGWLFGISDAEYQRCAPGSHVAAGSTTTDDGRRMSINVEQISDALIVEHYVAEVAEPQHCLLVSESDSITPAGWTKVHVTWELTVEADGDDRSKLSNRVQVQASDELLALLDERGVPFEQAAAARHQAARTHNEVETPLFARSIGRHALAASAAA